MPFEFIKTEILEVIIIKPKTFSDNRGLFMETYKKSDFVKAGIDANFIQDNYSLSSRGVLRGFHYQTAPYAQGKLVRCVSGRIFDVAVDIRKSSATFGRWAACELSSDNRKMLWIPPGFAHGFLTLSDNAEVAYKVSGAEYTPSNEKTIMYNDPDLSVGWSKSEVLLSEKDAAGTPFKDAEVFE